MIIEQLFGSNTRWRLLWIFMNNPEKHYFVRELARETDSHIHAVRRELENLAELKIIQIVDGSNDVFENAENQAKKKFYALNTLFPMFDELKALFAKDGMMGQQSFIDKLSNLGKVEYLLLSGVFTGDKDSDVDILIVGNIQREKVFDTCKEYEKMFDKELKYSVMTKDEYKYRMDVVDKFLYGIYDKKHVIVKDKINS